MDEINSLNEIKKIRHRSPNYPAIGLERALEKAAIIYEKARTHSIPVAAAFQIWGYKEAAGNQTTAALKAFGLIETIGEKEGRQLRVTETMRMIHMDHPNKNQFLKEAALKPEIHKEIWDKYQGDLPVDTVIRNYLVWERKFNEESVDSFLAQFRNTLAFSNISLLDKTSDKEEEVLVTEPTPPITSSLTRYGIEPETNYGNKLKSERQVEPLLPEETELKFNISQNSKARIIFTGEVTQEAIELLAEMLNIQKRTFKKEADLKPAMALSAENEIPIKVIGSLGTSADGKHYIKIARDNEEIISDNEIR